MSWSDAEFPMLGLKDEALVPRPTHTIVKWHYESYPRGLKVIVEPAIVTLGESLFVSVYASNRIFEESHSIDSPLQALAFIHDCVKRMSNSGGNDEVVTARGGRGTAS